MWVLGKAVSSVGVLGGDEPGWNGWRLFDPLLQCLLNGVFDYDLVGALDGSGGTDSFALSAIAAIISLLDGDNAASDNQGSALAYCQTETASVTQLDINDGHLEHNQPLTIPHCGTLVNGESATFVSISKAVIR
jgi:hypothetical protein